MKGIAGSWRCACCFDSSSVQRLFGCSEKVEKAGAIKGRDSKAGYMNEVVKGDIEVNVFLLRFWGLDMLQGVKEAIGDILESSMCLPTCGICGGDLSTGDIVVQGMKKVGGVSISPMHAP